MYTFPLHLLEMSHIAVALKYNCHDDKANLMLSTNKHKTLFFILLYSDIK